MLVPMGRKEVKFTQNTKAGMEKGWFLRKKILDTISK